MIIIIDGYNVIKQVGIAKQQFITMLTVYKHKGHTIHVIFDGGDQPYEYKEHHKGISVTYAGYKQTADDYIKKILEQLKHKDVLLVSSDNQLVRYAQHNNIESCDSLVFYQLLLQQKSVSHGIMHTQKLIKRDESSDNDELSSLMEETTRTLPKKQEDVAKSRSRTGHTLSKTEKRLLRKVKKL